jgi:hypothetical protein
MDGNSNEYGSPVLDGERWSQCTSCISRWLLLMLSAARGEVLSTFAGHPESFELSPSGEDAPHGLFSGSFGLDSPVRVGQTTAPE